MRTRKVGGKKGSFGSLLDVALLFIFDFENICQTVLVTLLFTLSRLRSVKLLFERITFMKRFVE